VVPTAEKMVLELMQRQLNRAVALERPQVAGSGPEVSFRLLS
jgi:hypothetical protein